MKQSFKDLKLSFSNITTGGIMLYWAIVFFIIALIAGIFGFGGIAATSAGIAQILFFIFLAVFVLSLILHFAKKVDRGTKL